MTCKMESDAGAFVGVVWRVDSLCKVKDQLMILIFHSFISVLTNTRLCFTLLSPRAYKNPKEKVQGRGLRLRVRDGSDLGLGFRIFREAATDLRVSQTCLYTEPVVGISKICL